MWKTRERVNTIWSETSRDKYKTKSRKYMLGSDFSNLLTAITDTKDWKALGIKCDPAYLFDSLYKNREETNTWWKVRFRS